MNTPPQGCMCCQPLHLNEEIRVHDSRGYIRQAFVSRIDDRQMWAVTIDGGVYQFPPPCHVNPHGDIWFYPEEGRRSGWTTETVIGTMVVVMIFAFLVGLWVGHPLAGG